MLHNMFKHMINNIKPRNTNFGNGLQYGGENRKPKSRSIMVIAGITVLTLFLLLRGSSNSPLCLLNSNGGHCLQSIPIKVPKHLQSLPYRMEDRTPVMNVPIGRYDGMGEYRPLVNSTLGFEKVYVLNLKEKRARKAEMQMLLRHYNITFEFVEGVDGKTDQTAPSKLAEKLIHGRKEGHAKIWQMMLQNRVNSAIILEDEIDMDRRIRRQLELLQEPLAVMLNIMHSGKNTTKIESNDPWNTPLWDMLWFGQCQEEAWKPESLPEDVSNLPFEDKPFLTYNDPTRSGIAHYERLFSDYGLPVHDNPLHTHQRLRLIQPAREARCLSAYALTRSGAARSLYQNAHRGWVRDVDQDLITLVREERLRAYTVNPALFTSRTAIDGNKEDGELTGEIAGNFRPLPGEKGLTRGIDNSAREFLLTDIMKDDKVIAREQPRKQ